MDQETADYLKNVWEKHGVSNPVKGLEDWHNQNVNTEGHPFHQLTKDWKVKQNG